MRFSDFLHEDEIDFTENDDGADESLTINPKTHTGDVTGGTALAIANDAVDIVMISASGTPDGTTYYRGDNTWSVPAGAGDVSKVGTPVNNEIGVWTGDGTIEGDTNLEWDATNLDITGNIVITDPVAIGN